MPRVPDASMVTRMRGLQSSVVADPTKKSASYVPAQPALLFALKSTDVARGMFPGGTILANPVVKGYVNPRHQGYVTNDLTPRITIDLGAADFSVSGTSVIDAFTTTNGVPPASTFEVAIINGTNVDTIEYVYLNDTLERGILSPVTISAFPQWGQLVQDVDVPYLYSLADDFPGPSTILTFRNVPIVSDLTLEFAGTITPP